MELLQLGTSHHHLLSADSPQELAKWVAALTHRRHTLTMENEEDGAASGAAAARRRVVRRAGSPPARKPASRCGCQQTATRPPSRSTHRRRAGGTR